MDYISLPKIELHAHLTGSVSRQTLREIWKRKKASGLTDLGDPQVVMPEGKHDYNLMTCVTFPESTQQETNATKVYQGLQSTEKNKGWIRDYIIGIQLTKYEESIRYAVTSVLRDFMADGVVYLELRTTPRSTSSMPAETYIVILLEAIEDFEKSHPKMHTRLILSIDRRHAIHTAESILELATRLRNTDGTRIVGIDLCGDPTARPGGEIAMFTPVFEQASKAGLGITVHFAEAEASASHEELRTLLSWNPGRLGHVIWEDEWAKQQIAQRGLCLELCLSCNVQADMICGGFDGHHFKHWKDVEGPKISLGTDDVGVFGSPLSNEYRLVARHFRLDRSQICALARQGIEGIFGGEQEKQRLRDIMWKE